MLGMIGVQTNCFSACSVSEKSTAIAAAIKNPEIGNHLKYNFRPTVGHSRHAGFSNLA
jgi:hypothetical protein